jgi:hypothetical protein
VLGKFSPAGKKRLGSRPSDVLQKWARPRNSKQKDAMGGLILNSQEDLGFLPDFETAAPIIDGGLILPADKPITGSTTSSAARSIRMRWK